MAFTSQEWKKLYALDYEGYFEGSVGRAAWTKVMQEADIEPRTPWFLSFLEGVEPIDTEIVLAEVWALERAEGSVFALFGRAEPVRKFHSDAVSTEVVRQWLRYGLETSPTVIAARCDVSQPYASQMRDRWGDEIRALLQEGQCLGLTGEDLYFACDPKDDVPIQLIRRLRELRTARGSQGGMLRQEFERWIKVEWFSYKQRTNTRYDSEWPPSWFVKDLVEDHL